jgi:hypothetical protein
MTWRRQDILEAARISCHACDFCNAVHVDFIDIDGDVFATASVPIEIEMEFMARFAACVTEIKGRSHAAPARRQ